MSYRSELIQVAAVAVAAIKNFDKGSTAENSYDILNEIHDERTRQEKKWGTQNHHPEKWYTILGEEFGEVGKAILENDFV
jgi:hypothetical protein